MGEAIYKGHSSYSLMLSLQVCLFTVQREGLRV